jgi:hypothetical protein
LTCTAGHFCLLDTFALGDSTLCQRGHYCPAGTTSMIACPSGYYNKILGASSIAQCLACDAGKTCPAGSVDDSAACPAGYWCTSRTGALGDSIPPQPCPAGRYGAGRTGLESGGSCEACPSGSYCVEGSDWPEPCPQGKFSNTVEAPSLGNCQSCSVGFACPLTGLTAPSSPCAPGHYCPLGTRFAFEFPCPAGTFTDATSLSDPNACSACPQGYFCPPGTGGALNPPQPCTLGSYCPQSSSAPLPCAPGTFANRYHLTDASACDACPASSYCVGGATTISGPCAAGHFCPRNTPTATSNPCPAGTFTTSTALTNAEECSVCPVGHYCPIGSTNAQACPAGSFGASTHQSTSTCTTCTAGHECPSTGLSAPIQCTKGFYSVAGIASHISEQDPNVPILFSFCFECVFPHFVYVCILNVPLFPGTSACTACTEGYYCPEDATTYAVMVTSYKCPAGTVSFYYTLPFFVYSSLSLLLESTLTYSKLYSYLR